ncbi:hypothetical protein QOZ80_4BG0351820 [Eleusine coracana subsp. coracana]|nr:hypothetical protein QOZ80_4BG0351820 [Eleusine coracana subsp. coracana]
MSTYSTATSERRGLRRRLFCDDDDAAAGGRQLETRLRDLERDWDTYKAISHSGAPRHRRTRSAATGTASSAVTAPGDPDLDELLRCSPRRLVYSISDGDSAGTDSAISVKGGQRLRLRGTETEEDDDAPSVGSVEVEHSVSRASSCSCPLHCAPALRRRRYSTSSSPRTIATDSSLSPASVGGGVVVVTDRATIKTEEARRVPGHCNRMKRLAAVALVAVVGVIAAAVAVLDLSMDKEEFLVPT